MTSPRPDAESLVLEELTDEERRALLAQLDAAEVEASTRLADVLSSLEGDDWRNAETPALRFVPEGGERRSASWSWGALRLPRVGGPALALGLAALILLSGLAGFAVRGGTTGGGLSKAQLAEAKLQTAPGISLVRDASAPVAAGGIARMMAGDVDRMMVRAHGLEPVAQGGYYEVWLRGAGGRMVSVGRFEPRSDGTIDARFPMTIDPKQVSTAIVTVQRPADGGAYSGRSVLRSASA